MNFPHRDNKKIPVTEIGAIRKDHRGRTRVALVYPNTYPVGMTNLGFQTVYRLLNEIDRVVCERAFLPQKGPGSTIPVIKTMESRRPLAEFDVIAFSVSFENDDPNILTILENAGIPLLAENRRPDHPFVLAGGAACFINPEPLSDFVDAFLIGEAEPVLQQIFDIFDPRKSRPDNIRNLSREVPGIYAPSLYRMEKTATGDLCAVSHRPDLPETIRRIHAADLSQTNTTSTVITPDTGFGRIYLIETGRGCPHGCRFCSAGYIYRPVRFRSLSRLEDAVRTGAEFTDKIGLVGAAITDLPHLGPLCDTIKAAGLQASFSSLRADRLTDPLISLLSGSGTKTATVAPDAGSERMRRVIRKGITEADVLSAVERLVSAGIPNLKLYFMVGLPTETEDDVKAIVELCLKIKQVFLAASRARKRIGTITVSVNPFVPKPFTPFQWAPMDDLKTMKSKMLLLQKGLRSIANIRLNMENPKQSLIQGILSRGDRETGKLLVRLHHNHGNWPKTLKEWGCRPEQVALRARSFDEILPWRIIDQGFDKGLLRGEYERALDESV